MKQISQLGAALVAALFMMAPLAAWSQDAISDPPAGADQDAATGLTDWQVVIDQQIEAFRSGDNAGALELAGARFKNAFGDPDRFANAILSWGYEPILKSVSHSFGRYNAATDDIMLQIVQVIGNDQGYYQALYQMGREPDGWRVEGVQISEKQGMGI